MPFLLLPSETHRQEGSAFLQETQAMTVLFAAVSPAPSTGHWAWPAVGAQEVFADSGTAAGTRSALATPREPRAKEPVKDRELAHALFSLLRSQGQGCLVTSVLPSWAHGQGY